MIICEIGFHLNNDYDYYVRLYYYLPNYICVGLLRSSKSHMADYITNHPSINSFMRFLDRITKLL